MQTSLFLQLLMQITLFNFIRGYGRENHFQFLGQRTTTMLCNARGPMYEKTPMPKRQFLSPIYNTVRL